MVIVVLTVMVLRNSAARHAAGDISGKVEIMALGPISVWVLGIRMVPMDVAISMMPRAYKAKAYAWLHRGSSGEAVMKFNVEVECTPAEARQMMGLPDLAPVHEKYIASLTDAMDGVVSPDLLDGMVRSWAPMGDAGMNFWRKMFDSAGKPTG
jgi:hypothetical protein